jgi:hypothetical protein
MALPRETAQKIVDGIHQQFGRWNFSAQIITSENSVLVKNTQEGLSFGWAFGDFAELAKGWSVEFIIHEGWPAVLIW